MASNVTIPWQLRYAAEVDYGDAGTGVVAFNCDMVDANGLGVFEDRCMYCGVMIQNGLEVRLPACFAQFATLDKWN